MVALAQRLAGILYVMWRDKVDDAVARVRTRACRKAEVATA